MVNVVQAATMPKTKIKAHDKVNGHDAVVVKYECFREREREFLEMHSLDESGNAILYLKHLVYILTIYLCRWA